MRKVYEVGDRIEFTEFYYTNKCGGTVVSGLVIKAFDDYETGRNFHVKLDEPFAKLLEKKAKKPIAFISEFDLVKL